jgi:hypothetical protein
VSGALGLLGDELALQLSTLDVQSMRVVGRHSLIAPDAKALSVQAATAIRATFQGLSSTSDGAQPAPLRVVVLDFTVAAAVDAAPPPPASPSLLPAVLVGVGAASIVAGAALDLWSVQMFDATSRDLQKSATDAERDYDTSDALGVSALVGYIAGGLLVVGGGALWLLAPTGAE